MARGTQFATLVTMLRAELRRSSSVAVGVDDLYSLKQTLSRTQEVLYDGYDWPFLVTFFSGRPKDIDRGIDFEDYAAYNPDDNVRSDPVQKWDIRWTGIKEQVEVWPIPASNLCSLQWRSFRKLRPLVNDFDPADLDDQLIVLFSAADLGAGSGLKDAGTKLQMAQQRLVTLKANAKAVSKPTRIGIGAPNQTRAGIIVRVR
jgi:hypothetical protein